MQNADRASTPTPHIVNGRLDDFFIVADQICLFGSDRESDAGIPFRLDYVTDNGSTT